MNVAIYGAGAMGTILGAYITKAGYEIDLINRNQSHVDALNKQGATIIGTLDLVQPVTALLPSEMSKTYDIILLMTKQRHNKEIVQFLQPFLNDCGVICTMQNGIPEPVVAEVIGNDRTIGCTMSWGATFHGEGVVELTTVPSYDTLTFNIGKYGDNDPTLFDHIVMLLKTMGKVTIEENFIGARWAKLLINAAFSGLSVITGATYGELNKNRTSRRLALDLIQECIAVAEAADIRIEPLQGKDIVKLMRYDNWFKQQFSLFLLPIAMRKHNNIRSSMLRDLKRGLPTEIDAINGVVCQYGQQHDIPTPLNDAIVTLTHQIESGELSSDWSNLHRLQKE